MLNMSKVKRPSMVGFCVQFPVQALEGCEHGVNSEHMFPRCDTKLRSAQQFPRSLTARFD